MDITQTKITFRVCTENRLPNSEVKGVNWRPCCGRPWPGPGQWSPSGQAWASGAPWGAERVPVQSATVTFSLGFAPGPFQTRSRLVGLPFWCFSRLYALDCP